jgi:hypothetical protein
MGQLRRDHGPFELEKSSASPIDAEFCRDPTNASVKHFYPNLLELRVATFLEHPSPCATTVTILSLRVPVKMIRESLTPP